ncbi:polyamine deacetylase HDAC10-like [Protopterus annectens]|uniref:polyamine deacetylase HDAC10-like n=1 Tax=Protopterus annectens TaxID=7888 RepID=UPI001CFAFA59|nr:polyamine deacetylase HDAC10-like [Protopterus annectens]
MCSFRLCTQAVFHETGFKKMDISKAKKNAIGRGTAIIYDEEMARHKLLWDHPICSFEVPERLTLSHDRLKHYGLLERCVPVPVREATDEEILLVHSSDYLESVKTTETMNTTELKTFSDNFDVAYFHQSTFRCAKLSLGATLQLVDTVVMGQVQNGMALVRPPGHHSQQNQASGFCIFNNVAVAAEYAKRKHGLHRILIVDWDVHHGQGTQYCFEDDPSVLYFSWHRYEHQLYWPNLTDSNFDAVGKGKGAGFNINVPWNQIGMKTADYLTAFFHVLLPIAFEFNPELVIVSAGYDSAIGDPAGLMSSMPECYAHLTHLLMSLANGKLCVVLEGGYNVSSLTESVCMTVRTLLGDPVPLIKEELAPCLSASETIHNVKVVHQQYWDILKYQDMNSVLVPSTEKLKEEEGATNSLPILDSDPAKSFQLLMEAYIRRILPQVPPVRTAAAISSIKSAVLEKCVKLEDKSLSNEEITTLLSGSDLKCHEDETALLSLGRICCIIQQIIRKQVRNGFAISSDISLASRAALKYSLKSGLKRVLLINTGNMNIPFKSQEDGKVLLLQMYGKQEVEKRTSKHRISLNWQKSIEYSGDFLYALFEIILPLAYEHEPEFIIITVGSENEGAAVSQVVHVMQGLAEGRSLVLIQDSEPQLVDLIAGILLGDVAPRAEPYNPACKENLSSLERQRQELQEHWRMLQYSVN